MSTRTLLTALLATALTLPAAAQSETPPAEATPAVPAATVAGADHSGSQVSRDKDTLSVDFPDEDIKTILRNVADLFELNIVVPDTLTGKTSIKLRDVTWKQIFAVVLSPVGYSYVEEGNIIKIVSNELLQQEPPATEVFIINNAKAEELRPTITGLVDAAAGGKVEVNPRANALIITERPSRMNRIRTIIDQLDRATDQVMIESKFVEVTDRDIRNIGVNWASLQGMQLGVGNIQQTWDRARGQTVTNGTNSNSTVGGNSSSSTSNVNVSSTSSGTTGSTNNNNAITYVTGVSPTTTFNTNLNLQTGQVTGLPTSVASTTQQANFTPASGTTPASATAFNTYTGTITSGTNSSTSNSVTNTVTDTIGSTASNAVSNLLGLTNTASTNRLATAVFSASDFNIIISALKTQANTKVMSNPTVVTLNNTEATLNIGSEYPIPSYNYNSERGTFEVSGFQYKPIGIILKVTPQVNARGVIKLSLEPEISQQADTTSFGGAGGASIPIISTRKVKTQVSLKDGFTMGIGGLITDTKADSGNKVPVLGSIPVLGRLFSNKSVNNVSTNLLIFITAKSLSAEGAGIEDVFDPRAVTATGMTRDELPGHRAPKGTDLFSPPPAPKK
jgi:type IV pilus assembly protein PilQ